MVTNKLVITSFLLISLLLASCSSLTKSCKCDPIIEKVPVKCTIPDVPKSNLEKISGNDSYEEKLRKLIVNYGLLKEENYLLRQAIEVCK